MDKLNFKSRWEVEQNIASGWKAGKNNKVIVERTGYIPLNVRLKQFTIAGVHLQLQAKQFDFNDYKEIYHDMEVISPNDDIEETQSKLDRYYSALQAVQINKLKQNKIEKEHIEVQDKEIEVAKPDVSE